MCSATAIAHDTLAISVGFLYSRLVGFIPGYGTRPFGHSIHLDRVCQHDITPMLNCPYIFYIAAQ